MSGCQRNHFNEILAEALHKQAMTLKPCPFCGGEAKTSVGYIKCGGDELLLRASVYCGVCGVGKFVKFNAEQKPFEDFAKNFNDVVDMWNRRASDGRNKSPY